MPLRDYLCFKSNDISKINRFVETDLKGHVVSMCAQNRNAELKVYRIDGEFTSLSYVDTGYLGHIEFAPVGYHRFAFLLEGRMNLSLTGSSIEFDPRSPCCLLPARHPVTVTEVSACKFFSLHVDAAEIERRLALLVGRVIAGPVEFEQIDPANQHFVEFVRNPILNMARELRSIAPAVRSTYLREFEAMILTRLLLHARHDHSGLLEVPQARTTSDRVQRVQEYIHENWNKSLTSGDLEKIVDVSGRTLYSDFRSRYGVTPSQYIKRLRLENARAMLVADGGASVLEVALHCGFLSFGHFAAAYREMFGELPSATVRRR